MPQIFDPNFLSSLIFPIGKPNRPNSTVPEFQDSKPVIWPQAKRRKVRYGPYRIPPTSEKNLESELMNVQGMSNGFDVGMPRPCEGECTILDVSADLEYANGAPANLSSGAWFHHMVLWNAGPKVWDSNCGNSRVENIYMAGNERSSVGYGIQGAKIKTGYKLQPQDMFAMTTQLMNMEDKEKWVWITMNFEYLDGPQPDYKVGKPIWMSIGIGPGAWCPGDDYTKNPFGASNITISQQPKALRFSEHSMPWRALQDGYILSTGGHMHDGGVSTEIFKNDALLCDSLPHYAKTTQGHHPMHDRRQISGGATSNTEIEHIEKQDPCLYMEGVPLKKGDQMYMKVNYDFEKYPGIKNKKGELDEIMGIVGTLVAF